jgi:hypothetical protein
MWHFSNVSGAMIRDGEFNMRESGDMVFCQEGTNVLHIQEVELMTVDM